MGTRSPATAFVAENFALLEGESSIIAQGEGLLNIIKHPYFFSLP